MAEYTESFARFIIECKEAYADVCARIANGEVPAGSKASLTIEIPREVVDRIRFEMFAASAEANHG